MSTSTKVPEGKVSESLHSQEAITNTAGSLLSRLPSSLRPDNPITENGVLREFKNNAYRTRFEQHRADLKHLPIDLVMWGYLALIGAGIYFRVKAIKKAA